MLRSQHRAPLPSPHFVAPHATIRPRYSHRGGRAKAVRPRPGQTSPSTPVPAPRVRTPDPKDAFVPTDGPADAIPGPRPRGTPGAIPRPHPKPRPQRTPTCAPSGRPALAMHSAATSARCSDGGTHLATCGSAPRKTPRHNTRGGGPLPHNRQERSSCNTAWGPHRPRRLRRPWRMRRRTIPLKLPQAAPRSGSHSAEGSGPQAASACVQATDGGRPARHTPPTHTAPDEDPAPKQQPSPTEVCQVHAALRRAYQAFSNTHSNKH